MGLAAPMRDHGGGGGGRLLKLDLHAGVSTLPDAVFRLCMKTAIVLGSCYVGFVLYIAMTYTQSWSEKLRMLPLVIVAVTVPLLGAVLISTSNRWPLFRAKASICLHEQ